MKNESAPQLITERFDFDGGREVTVFVPTSPPAGIVFAADGALIAPWGANADLPVLVVGVHATSDQDEMARIREYSPSFDAEIFAAHEQFFVHEVRQWVEQRFNVTFPRERTAVCGVSAGGELALAMGVRHPEVYGHVFCMSPGGGYTPPEHLPSELPRFYFTAGSGEPWFLENAVRWVTALQNAGTEVMMTERDGDHGGPFWEAEFPLMVKWAFGKRPCPYAS